MKQAIIYFFVILIWSTTSVAYAQCLYNGQWVPTGTKAGGYTCQANGDWK